MKSRNTMKKWVIGQSLLLALGISVGSIGSAQAEHKDSHGNNGGNNGNGPQFSLDIETFCGVPNAMEIDMYGNVVNIFNDEVAVRLTDVSDDNGPADAEVGLLEVECIAAVKTGRGKPSQQSFSTQSIWYPDLGVSGQLVFDTSCPLDLLPEGATEWKVRATASGGDVRREVSDSCEEVTAP